MTAFTHFPCPECGSDDMYIEKEMIEQNGMKRWVGDDVLICRECGSTFDTEKDS